MNEEQLRKRLTRSVDQFQILMQSSRKDRKRKMWTEKRCQRQMKSEAGYGAVPLWVIQLLWPVVWRLIIEFAGKLFSKLNDETETK